MRTDVAEIAATDIRAENPVTDGSELDIAQCQRMLRMLDGQLADLEKAVSSLRSMRVRWQDRLDLVRAKPAPYDTGDRAPHGALRKSVLTALEMSADGMTLSELDGHISETTGHSNRQSLSLSLNRLKAAGLVAHRNRRWHFAARI